MRFNIGSVLGNNLMECGSNPPKSILQNTNEAPANPFRTEMLTITGLKNTMAKFLLIESLYILF